MPTKYLWILAGLALGAPAWAQQWFGLGSPNEYAGTPIVEIDLDTVRVRSQGGEGVIRVTLDAPQAHSAGFSYRSFIATAHFDCQRRSMQLTSAAYYALPAGGGVRLGADSSGRESGMPPGLLQRIPTAARQAILKAACAQPVN
jgi:hypothetical protein